VLTAGLFVRVQLPLGDPRNHVLIPERAIGTDLGQKYVLVANKDNVAEYRKVLLGSRTEDGLRVVVEGLSPDDSVIVNGMQHARPGVTVNPRQAESEKSTASLDSPAKAK
jgi:multidrug efflux pump subunit AcrA (membrane-fusion protein)